MNDDSDNGPGHGHRRLWLVLAVLAGLLMLAAAWRWTPLSGYVSLERLGGLLQAFDSPITRGAAAIGGILVASLLMVPLTLLAVAAGAVLGGLAGFVCATVAAVLSAAIGFWLGRMLSRDVVERVAGERVKRVNAQLADQGVTTVAIARLVPAAPFTIFNLVAGTSKLRFRPYLIGTSLALAPGIGALTLFSDSVRRAFTDPSPGTIAMTLGIVATIALVAWFAHRRLAQD